ncbi:MAG: LacI family DNA-binding transcriptional regulator [Actinomycetota bacterium]|nr:LacI family DNA-binding transcriptional regulator [Actinomycetota bacterium]
MTIKGGTGSAPTMKEIARMAGVSQATVSYVINNTEGISDAVRKRVQEAADELGYIPNMVARNLKKRKTNIIGILVPDVMNNYYNEVIKYVEKLTRERGYFIFIGYTMHDPNIEDWYTISLIQQKVAGVIVCYGLTNRECYKKLQTYNVQFVAIDDEVKEANGQAPSILINNIRGSFLAVKHLVSLGIKDIAYCSEHLYSYALRERYQGFLEALDEFGLTVNQEMIYIADKKHGYEKINLGYMATKEILSRSRPRGIFASNDQIAFGIIKRLNEMKIKIPQDIAVIGYDNIPFSSVLSPSLTTVNQPIKTMSVQGVKTLLKTIRQEDNIKKRLLLEPNLVVRESAPNKL